MSKKFLLWLSLIFFVSGTFEYAYSEGPTTEAYDNKPVGNIEITAENLTPNSSFDPKSVQMRLKTRVGDPFSQHTFDSDLKTLSEDYDRIEPSLEVHNGQIYIKIKVWPRPAIRTIKWEGNKFITTKTLQKELGVKPHSVFNRQGFNKSFNKVKEYYIKKGYFESQLQYTVYSDPKTNEVDVVIEVIEGRSGKIDEIVFNGFTSDEKSELLEMIKTKNYYMFISWFTGRGIYSEEDLDQDRLIIINFLQNEGYADAKVDIQIKEAPSEGKIIIEITCDKGSIFHYGDVTYSGNKLFSNEQIERRISIHKDEVYSPEEVRSSAQRIKDMYGRKGYINASVPFETKLIENEPLYDVHYEIEEGEQFKIGLIHVFGNKSTLTHVILRESLLIPGQTFDSEKLKKTQERLENIGYFKTVNVYAVRTQDDQLLGDNYRDVYIEVTEALTGNFSLFGGFSSSEDVFGGLDLTETNFNYKGIPNIFRDGLSAIRGGGEYARMRFTVGAKQKAYALSWMDPYFRDSLWRLGIDLSVTNSNLQSESYSIYTYGGTIYTGYPINSLWAFGARYRVRDEHVNVKKGAPREERREAASAGVISAVGTSLNYDSTDSAVKPHNGFRSSIDGELSGLGGKYTFFRFGYINTLYNSIWEKGIVKTRLDLRYILPYWKTDHADQIPIGERFFLGGDTSVRGYKPFDLGPRFDNGDPTGGISATLFSIEYLQEVFKVLDAFVFFDAGNVSQKAFHVTGKYNCSVGFGVRCDAINRIPIILGYGYPINPDSKEQEQRFFFNMGGQF